jgi:hypothetical protein
VEHDLSGSLLLQLVDTPEQCGFSGAGGTHDADDLTGTHIHVYFSQNLMIAKGFAEILY